MVRVVRVLRWVLFFEGWLLLVAPATVLRWVSYLEKFFQRTSPASSHNGWFTFVCWTMGALCLATFWGQGRQKRWTRWTGLIVSLFNLAIFPPLGLTGLFTMRRFSRFHLPEDADQDSVMEESPSIRVWRTILTLGAMVVGYGWLDTLAESQGVAGSALELSTLCLILIGQVGVALIHDIGHILVAYVSGFTFPAFRVGPWIWVRKPSAAEEPKRQWNRLFAHDSYLSGVPRELETVRTDLMVSAAAGPLLSLLLSLMFFLIMMQSAGTQLSQAGRIVGILALLFALDFSIHMLPFGFSDGRLLVDLISNNRRGQKIVERMLASVQSDSTAESPVRAPRVFDPVVQRREALARMLSRGASGGLPLAIVHQELGIAEFLTGNSVSAREHLDRSLDLFSGFPRPLNKGRSWIWLEKLHRRHQKGVEAHYAYGRGVQSWEAEKNTAKSMEAMAECRISLAFLHLGQNELGTCMEELEKVEHHMPKDILLAGRYHHALAVCGYRMRWQDRSLQHATAAAKAYQSSKLKSESRGLGLLYLADLAEDLWLAGQTTQATNLLRAVIDGLAGQTSAPAANYFRLLRAEILAKTGDTDEATAERDRVTNPDPEQERRGVEVSGWIALARGNGGEAAECFDSAANTLDERERARLMVAEARALAVAGQGPLAAERARTACDVLMREEHGDAGIALLLLSAQMYAEHPILQAHPFFEEGRRILRAARFQPAPDKLLALRDLVHLFESIERPIESGDLKEEMMWILQQITWQTPETETPAPEADEAFHESA